MANFDQIEYYPEIKERASLIAAKYGLREGSSRSINYFWLGRDFAIVFLLSRDGASVRYVDLHDPTTSETYFLGHFLVASRRTTDVRYPAPPQTLKPSVLISTELDFLLTLLDQSPDILRGDRAWLAREYKRGRLRTPPHWKAEIEAFRARVGNDARSSS